MHLSLTLSPSIAISNAYVILSDPEKRSQYDQFGEDGLRRRASRYSQGFETNFDPDELFRSFFGDNFMFGGNSRKPNLPYGTAHGCLPHARSNRVCEWFQSHTMYIVLFVYPLAFVYTYHSPRSQQHYVFRNFRQHHRAHHHGAEEVCVYTCSVATSIHVDGRMLNVNSELQKGCEQMF